MRLTCPLHQKLRFSHTERNRAPPISSTAKFVVLACLTKKGACSQPLFARIFDPLTVLLWPSETGGGSGLAARPLDSGGDSGPLEVIHGEGGFERVGTACWPYCCDLRRSA